MNSEYENANQSLVNVDYGKDQLAEQKIREMADIFRLTDEDLEYRKIIYPRMRDKRLLKVFRDIRTKLIEKASEDNFSLMVTSICESAGNTFITNNLAASIALDQGKTSVIVDCNLYSPASFDMLEGENIGFSDFLENPSVSLEEVIYATGIPRLRYVPIGKSTDIGPEYYSSYRMRHFLSELKERYSDRYVILDAPPIGSAADARILADCCDYVLIIVPYGRVTEDQIAEAVESIPREKLVGVVFNN